jgi:hypothetical protein
MRLKDEFRTLVISRRAVSSAWGLSKGFMFLK